MIPFCFTSIWLVEKVAGVFLGHSQKSSKPKPKKTKVTFDTQWKTDLDYKKMAGHMKEHYRKFLLYKVWESLDEKTTKNKS